MSKFLLVSGLVLIGLGASPLARAETSYHKLKKKLHKVEHETGEVIRGTGEVLEEGLSGLDIDIGVSITDIETHKAKGNSGGHSEKATSTVPNHPVKEATPKLKRE